CSSGWFEPAGQRLRLVPPASIRSSSAFKDRRCFRTVSSTVYIGWLSLHPPRRGRLVANHDLIQERGGLGKPFVGRHESVLVLDGQNVVIAEHAQRRDELSPPRVGVAVAAGAEDPGAIPFVRILLGVEYAGLRQVRIVDL